MNQDMARDLSDWLRGVRNVVSVRPIYVQIGIRNKQKFFGAQYIKTDAVTTDNVVSNHRLYLLGDLPAIYKRSKDVRFQLDVSPNDWIVSGFFNQAWLKKHKYPLRDNFKDFNPFGDWFSLSPVSKSDPDIQKYQTTRGFRQYL